MTTETMNFNADVSRLLDIVANALYTNHDVFLRELISNAADACDRLRYEAIQNPALTKDNPDFRIHTYKDTTTRTLTLVDNGIGMTRAELIDHLGTIAKSGTAALMERMKDSKDNLKLIGQFGVGFYASYMVASKVSVISRHAGSSETWTWESDGRTGFDVREATKEDIQKLDGERGTAIVLHIKDEAVEFLLDDKIKQTATHYSDHIDLPIYLGAPSEITDKDKPLNKASALWTRPKSEITKEQYTEFYRHITHGFDEPLMTAHWRAEGKIEYTGLLFVPMMRPWDLYDPSRRCFINLYVRRVFISDSLETLMYPWLRFLRGMIDSQDLPLNISRESLQYNPLLPKIRSGVARKILGDLDKLSRDDEHGFHAFWGQFGAVVKEGLYDAAEHREDIFKICRFFSTHEDGEKLVSLDDYVSRMKEGQTEIYYISGEKLDSLLNSPQLEGFKAHGLEVLFFTDTIDDFWLQNAPEFKDKKFKSVTKGDIDLDQSTNDKKEDTPKASIDMIARLKELLKDDVSDVRASKRLTDSPVCIVAQEGGIDMHMERVLKVHQKYAGGAKPVLEINLKHPLIEKMAAKSHDSDLFKDAALLLLDQARIIQGQPVNDAGAFARRMSTFISGSF
ncbi:MAG: molecular chaperone HtpG [Alphaproteobacteria bacterium]